MEANKYADLLKHRDGSVSATMSGSIIVNYYHYAALPSEVSIHLNFKDAEKFVRELALALEKDVKELMDSDTLVVSLDDRTALFAPKDESNG